MKEKIPTTFEEKAGPSSQLKALKEKVQELNDRYKSEMQREEKAILYSQLEKAQREYRALEEELDKNLPKSDEERKVLKLKFLKEKVQELNDRYKSEMQREEKAILYSQLEKAQREYRALEEELDKISDKEKEKNVDNTNSPEEPAPPTTPTIPEDGNKKPEEKEKLLIMFIDLLEKAKGGDAEAVEILIEFVITHDIEITIIGPEPTPEEQEAQKMLLLLLEKIQDGDITVINELIMFLSIHIVTITVVVIQETTPEPVPQTPESDMPLEDLRDLYLKAKRLRGNVFRGKLGRLFGRKLNFGGEKMDFGGKKGAEDLEKVRKEYQEKLAQYRSGELEKFQKDLDKKIAKGMITLQEANLKMQEKIIDLLGEEQKNIDTRSVEGIEKNLLEKMKTKWRQFGRTRLVAGGLLGGAALAGALGVTALSGGTAAGVGILGARTAMGAVGTYVGVEAGLERYSKLVGHKGLVSKISKGGPFITEEALYKNILLLPDEDVKREAARLRMLQVEKGVSIDNLKTLGDDGKIAAMIIKRDNELITEEVLRNTLSNPALFVDRLSSSLAREINLRNEIVESEVDRERIKKMVRKTTAMLAGGAVGWIIGGKLFQKPEAVPPPHLPNPTSATFPPNEIPSHVPHIVTHGENTWKIIEANLDSHNTMAGLGEGTRTHMIDALKDMFDKMSPADLRHFGFSSGDANLLYAGNTLDMSSVLDNPEIITRALFNARHLPAKDIVEIVKNNHQIASWLAAHHQELKGLFNSSVIEKVLRGTI